MKIRISDDFKVAYKRLKKRHRSLETDFERLLASLLINPEQGVELVEGTRKIRLAISSNGVEEVVEHVLLFELKL